MVASSASDGVRGNQTLSAVAAQSAQSPQPAATSAATESRRTYLNLTGVARKFEVSERTAARLVLQPWFPKPIQLVSGTSRGVRRWVEQEIDEATARNAPREEIKSEPEQLKRARDQRRSEAAVSEGSECAA